MKIIKLRKNERRTLERVMRSQSGQAGLARRARMIVMSADGVAFNQIRQRLNCDVRFIQRWRERFTTERVAGLTSQPRGRPANKIDARLEARVLRYAVTRKPADGSTHWSSRKLSAELGGVISHNAIAKIWRAHGIKPHRLAGYMTTNDPQFEQKAADIIGLYLNPPAHAAVFCVDEKTAIQALDRKDPVLPLSPGRAERHGFEYKRHGTLSLYAAFATRTGQIIGKTAQRHTSVEFVGFLGDILASQPAKREIHVIADNLSAHKTDKVAEFLAEHPQVHLHYTPTYSSWLNQVELWFGKIERDVITRGVFSSVPDLKRKLMRYIRQYNKRPKTVKWKYFDPTHRIKAA
jgi:transposase